MFETSASRMGMFHREVIAYIASKYRRLSLKIIQTMEWEEIPNGKIPVFCRRIDRLTKAVSLTASYCKSSFEFQKTLVSRVYLVDRDFPIFPAETPAGQPEVAKTSRPKKTNSWARRSALLCSIF